MQEKYGFVYIWRDRKRRMFYIGCHWGTIEDGYICSCKWMRDAYRYRSDDFKRRILSTNLTREMLFDEEFKWLQLIKKEEVGVKYYNLRHHKWGHWSHNASTLKTVGEKISESPLRNERISKANKGRVISVETRQKLREINLGTIVSEETKQKIKNLWQNPEYLEKQRIARSNPNFYDGFRNRPPISEETKRKIGLGNTGKKHSEQLKKEISEHFSNSIWITNRIINKRIATHETMPEGFNKGRMKNKPRIKKTNELRIY